MQGTSHIQMSFEFSMSENNVRALIKKYNLPKRDRRRAPPPDLTQKLAELGIEGARLHFQTGWNTIKRWMADLGIKKPQRIPANYGPRPLVIPSDWAEIAPTKYKFELAEYYRCGIPRINRLIEATGIRSRKTVHELAAERPPEEPKPRRPRRVRFFRPVLADRTATANQTVAAEAANFLRRTHTNVHRCDIQLTEFSRETWGDRYGVPDHGIGYYFVAGRGIMTDDELIELAQKGGFCRTFH